MFSPNEVREIGEVTLPLVRKALLDLTDTTLIGEDAFPGDAEFLADSDTYRWYCAVGRVLAPESILEFGVRYGYSTAALLKGSGRHCFFVGVDGEIDGVESSVFAMEHLKKYDVTCQILDADTRNIAETNENLSFVARYGKFDLVHVDADHSPEGIKNELWLAEFWVHPQGFILVDDIDTPHVKEITDQFCQKHGILPLLIPTTHGMYLIDMGSRTKND